MSKVLKKFISVKGQITGLYTNKKIVGVYRSEISKYQLDKNDWRLMQNENMKRLKSKVAEGEEVVFDCDGDSLTYGQDEFSSDKRPTFSDRTIDSSVYRDESIQAGITYPEVLLQEIDRILPNSIVVNNRGISGMHAQTNLEVWDKTAGADINIVMLGTNDCRKNISIHNFFEAMSKIVERRLDWGGAVVLVKPPFKREPDKAFLGFYRETIEIVGEVYDVPVWDTEDFLSGDRRGIFCDKVHLNSKGYTLLGKGITSKLISLIS